MFSLKRPSFDNPAFQRSISYSDSSGVARDKPRTLSLMHLGHVADPQPLSPYFDSEGVVAGEETDIDEDSFRSDLERDSEHLEEAKDEFDQRRASNSMSHEQRHELLLREANRRASLQYRQQQQQQQQPAPVRGQTAAVAPPASTLLSPSVQSDSAAPQFDIAVISVDKLQHGGGDVGGSRRSSSRTSRRRTTPPRSEALKHQQAASAAVARVASHVPVRPREDSVSAEKPFGDWSNLFGLIDLGRFGGGRASNYGYHLEVQRRGEAGEAEVEGREVAKTPASRNRLSQSSHLTAEEEYKERIMAVERRRGFNDALQNGAISAFVGFLLLLMSFCSPYWLASWQDTQSPFVNAGLWEFCFFRFRHPDYQFDKMFHGCHALYGDEYRLIREKLLPGWLMVVQFFVTIAFMFSGIGLLIIVMLFLRYPLEVILRFEYHFCGLATICEACASVLLFLGIVIFGSCCWDRDWLLYPNYNYVSWSYAFAVFANIGLIAASLLMLKDCKDAKERKEKNKALIMQMQPPGFSSYGSHMGGSGFV